MVTQLSKGSNILISDSAQDVLMVRLNWAVPNAYELDTSAFMLNSSGKVPNDEAMIFFNQPMSADNAVQYDANKRSFTVNLKKLNPAIQKIAFTLTIHEGAERGQSFKNLHQASIQVFKANQELANYQLVTQDLSQETALIFAELYKHNGQWKCKAVGQGFNGGLAALCGHFGVDVAEEQNSNNNSSDNTKKKALMIAAVFCSLLIVFLLGWWGYGKFSSDTQNEASQPISENTASISDGQNQQTRELTKASNNEKTEVTSNTPPNSDHSLLWYELRLNNPDTYNRLITVQTLADGNSACASYDGVNCLWNLPIGNIDFNRVNPLICGNNHKAHYGITGYESKDHWCRASLEQSAQEGNAAAATLLKSLTETAGNTSQNSTSVHSGSDNSAFSIHSKSSFSPTADLKQGDTIEFLFEGLKQNEIFNVQKCGKPCNTAKLITSWSGSSVETGSIHSITIAEKGEYYFWVVHRLETGEIGPVFIDSGQNDNGFFKVKFESGSVVGVRFTP